jgi:mono/diheme cytochrome c family protein
MIKGMLAGAVLTLSAGALAAYLAVAGGLLPANADAKPPRLERWAAHKSLKATIEREAPKAPNPVAATDENLIAGVRLYAANCAVCHGVADGRASNVAQGLYQRAPQLAKHGVEDDEDGENYWKVYHGIRLTGMPSYRATLSETQIWQLVLFLKHMDALTPAAQKEWTALPSSAPGDAPRPPAAKRS